MIIIGVPALLVTSVASGGDLMSQNVPMPPVDADFYENGMQNPEKVELGRLLFFDKVLSGNQNISCASCHHPLTHTGDGLSLSVGEGGHGLGKNRLPGRIYERVPRNAMPLFNLGAREFQHLFADGRVEVDNTAPSGFRSPAEGDLPAGLDNVLAAQAMFPVASALEMAGQAWENPIGAAAAIDDFAGPGGVWQLLANRLRAIKAYRDQFIDIFDDVAAGDDIQFRHAANAIAAFEAVTWRADNSPFDHFLRGDKDAMNVEAYRGGQLFYGRAGCVVCHSGAFQTDQNFHAIAVPQIGPGKGDGIYGREDFGRERVTSNTADRYKFRTPSLRNVVLTGPWGHSGAYNSLEAMVRHHLDGVSSLHNYDRSQAVLPSRGDLDPLDFVVQGDPARRADIAAAAEIVPTYLTDSEIGSLVEFLHTLTDASMVDLSKDVPRQVPSGLPLAD